MKLTGIALRCRDKLTWTWASGFSLPGKASSFLAEKAYLQIKIAARDRGWQVGTACVVGAIVIAFSFLETRQHATSLLSFSTYFTYLIGVAAITILVNSITVGLLLYNFQSIQSERTYYYDKFRAAAAALRDNLDSLYDAEFLGPEYDEAYRDIERRTMQDLPVGWKEQFIPFLEALFDELRNSTESEDEYKRISGETEILAQIINEAASGLWVNLIRRVVMRTWVTPVIKSFWTLVLTLLAATIGAVYFYGVVAHILTGVAAAIGWMTILLILEIGWLANKESKEFFDDDTDVEHPSTDDSPQNQGTSGTA
jgi:hypothetical protein